MTYKFAYIAFNVKSLVYYHADLDVWHLAKDALCESIFFSVLNFVNGFMSS